MSTHERGFLNEAASAFLFGVSAYSLAYPLVTLDGGRQLIRAILQQTAPPEQLATGMGLWLWVIYALAFCVVVLFTRLLASYTMFDYDEHSCKQWARPLNKFGNYAEVIVRVGMLLYIALALGNVIPSLSYSIANAVLSIEDTVIRGATNGTELILDADAAFLRTSLMQDETREVFTIVGYLFDLLIAALIWDFLMLFGRKTKPDLKLAWTWAKRFLIPHLFALLVVAFFGVVLFIALVQQDSFSAIVWLAILSGWVFLGAILLFATSVPIVYQWVLLIFEKSKPYRDPANCCP